MDMPEAGTRSMETLKNLFEEQKRRAIDREKQMNQMTDDNAAPAWLAEGEIVYLGDLDETVRDHTVYDVMKLDGETVDLADIETGKIKTVSVRDHSFRWAGDVLY